MLSDKARQILLHHIDRKGRKAVSAEVGISTESISMLLNDKYPASTKRMEKRIINTYGNQGRITCPVLGQIDVSRCATNHQRALVGLTPSNPRTLQLWHACRRCELRD